MDMIKDNKKMTPTEKKIMLLSKFSFHKSKKEIMKELDIKGNDTYYKYVREVFKDNIREDSKYESILQMLNQRNMLIKITYNELLKILNKESLLDEKNKAEDKNLELSPSEKYKKIELIRLLSVLLDGLEKFKSRIGLLPSDTLDVTLSQTSFFDDINESAKKIVEQYKSVLDKDKKKKK